MKKSQIAAAIALSYVAGGIVTPFSGVFAESVQESCVPSADEAYAAIITGEDIDAIMSAVQDLPIYVAYHNLQTLKTKTYTIAKAKAIDQAVTDANSDKATVEGALNTAQGVVDAIDKDDLATKIRQLSGAAYELDASAEPEDLLEDAQDSIPHYDLYLNLIESIKDGKYDLSSVQAAVQALVDAEAELNFDADVVAQADKWSVAKNEVVTDKKVYAKILRFYEAEQKVADRDAKQAEYNNVTTELDEAEAARDAALAEIKAAFEAVKNVDGYTVTISYNQAQTSVEGMVRYIKNDKISDYDQWEEFASYVESVHGYVNADANATLYTEIEAKFNAMLSEKDATQILNPTSEHKVCSADGSVAVRGLLPDNKLVVKIEKVANLTDATLANLEQAVYDITIEHKGTTYSGLVGEYQVTVNVPADMNGETATVYYVNGNNREVMPSEFDADNNTITFTTNHFSHYALVGENNFGGNDPDSDNQFGVDGPDEDFGGNASEGDAGFTGPEGPDEDFGGFDDDKGFTATPIVSVGTEPIVKPAASTAETPNTGVAVSATTGNATATSGIIAGLIAMAGAAIAIVVRSARRGGRKA